jgi:hypothetical protein
VPPGSTERFVAYILRDIPPKPDTVSFIPYLTYSQVL